MPTRSDPNALWVAVSEYGEGNIFHVYPKLLAELLLQDDATRQTGDTSEAEKLVLPSDKEWKLQQYFMLVALQKTKADNEDSQDSVVKSQDSQEEPEVWAPWRLVVATKNTTAPPPVAVKTSPGPAWDIARVLKAAGLLCKPPLQVDFADEQEMRCVYSLIYDVFRYKAILNQALQDVDFFRDFPQMEQAKDESTVNQKPVSDNLPKLEFSEERHAAWLFLMELTRRQWGARPRGEIDRATSLLESSPFKDLENAIWQQRVHFAAAIARIRIKNKAFSLCELLPSHLREERISTCVYKETVTGWVNTFKAKKVAALVKRLHDLGYSYSNSKQLCAGEYRFDRVCPRFITLRPPHDVSFGQLDVVKEGIIVIQEREFCEGASTLCRALRVNSLQGAVAQSHASSPRCSAYLAALLRELAVVVKSSTSPSSPTMPELGKLIVFGAGDKVENYVGALRDLGIDASEAPHFSAPVCVLSDPVYEDSPLVAKALDGVVAVLATPPNSYSAVSDPIDLICGRGGDLTMLEILTESEIDVKGKERVQLILEEQKKTLNTLMSKPQIQLILYETHSALEAENQTQLTRAVAEANRLARERHFLLRKKNRSGSPNKAKDLISMILADTVDVMSNSEDEKDEEVLKDDLNISSSSSILVNNPIEHDAMNLKKKSSITESTIRPSSNKARPIPESMAPMTEARDPDKDNPDIIVPDSDLFEIRTLPNLGNGLDINYILDRDGCFLGLIQRKEITRLDAKYMIRMAEERGLFGQPAPAQPPRKKKENSAPKRRNVKKGFEVERIAAPTYSSICRANRYRRGSAPAGTLCEALGESQPCAKHVRRQALASALCAGCTCDARHNSSMSGERYSSADNHVSTKRARRQVASGAFCASTHEARHKIPIRARRASADLPVVHAPSSPCRRLFPLAIHDLRLKHVLHRKIFV